MLKVAIFVFFFNLPKKLISDSTLDYKDSMNSTGCGS
jgi:hypothetical protein